MRLEQLTRLRDAVLHDLENDPLLTAMAVTRRWKDYFSDFTLRLNPDTYEDGHARNTFKIACCVTSADVAAGNISRRTAVRQQITALKHDVGELGKGDIRWWEHTDADTQDEIAFFNRFVDSLFPTACALPLGKEQLLLLFTHVAQGDRKTPGTNAYYFYHFLEVPGYLLAIQDFFAERTPGFDWEVACKSVLLSHDLILLRVVKERAAVRGFLSPHASDLTELVEYFAKHPLDFANPAEAILLKKAKRDIDFAAWRETIRLLKQ